MNKFRVSRTSELHAGAAGNVRSDAPMEMVMDMVTVARRLRAKLTCETIVRNENGKQRWRSEAPKDPSD
jgi:hypothetical protein